MHAVSHARIVPILPEPPPAPAELPPVEEPDYPTPDPHARPCSSNLPGRSSFEAGEVMAIHRRVSDGTLKVPYNELTGTSVDLTKIGACQAQLPASEWFCLFNRNVAPGVVASLIALAATRAGQSRWEKGSSFVGLSQSVRFTLPVAADGRMIRAESSAADWRVEYVKLDAGIDRAYDADGRLIATIQSLGAYVESAQRQRPATTPSKRMLCTLLFTDIVGSTQHAERLGDQKWHALLDEQRKKIRAEIARCQGTEVDTAGDASSCASIHRRMRWTAQ